MKISIKLLYLLNFIFVFSINAQQKIKFGYHDANGKVKPLNINDNQIDKDFNSNSSVDTISNKVSENLIIDTLNNHNIISNILLNDSKSDTLEVSLLLPFFMEHNNRLHNNLLEKNKSLEIYNKSKLAISFLQGVLFALDSISTPLKINIYDTEGNIDRVSEILVNNSLIDTDIIIGPLLKDNFNLVKRFYNNDTNKILINPLTKRKNIIEQQKNVFLLQSIDDNIHSKFIRDLEYSNVVILDYLEENIEKKDHFIKQLSLDSISSKYYSFNNLNDIGKNICKEHIKDNTVFFIINENPAFVDRLISFMSICSSDFGVFGLESWLDIEKFNIEMLMDLGVKIPVTNYFNTFIKQNNKLQLDFENRFYNQMNNYSILGFKTIMHFCSENTQFNFKQMNKYSGYYNANVEICRYIDFRLEPIN